MSDLRPPTAAELNEALADIDVGDQPAVATFDPADLEDCGCPWVILVRTVDVEEARAAGAETVKVAAYGRKHEPPCRHAPPADDDTPLLGER